MSLGILLYLVSLGLYPVEEAKLPLGPMTLPLPIVLLVALVGAHFARFLTRFRRLSVRASDLRLAGGAVLLFGALLCVSLAAMATWDYTPDIERLKGLSYIVLLPVLAALMGRVTPRHLLFACMLGCMGAVMIGYFRFVTLQSGLLSEHLLGYWGIRYLPSTRNSDVLYPLFAVILGMAFLFDLERLRSKLMLLPFVVLSVLAVLLSLSRGAWIALAFGLAVLFAVMLRQRRMLLRFVASGVLLGVLSTGLILLGPSTNKNGISNVTLLTERFATIVDGKSDSSASNDDRMQILQETLEGMIRYPQGVGVGNLAHAMGRQDGSIGNAENAYLTMGAEGGWISGLLFVSIMVALTRGAARHARAVPNLIARAPCALMWAIMVYFAFNYEANSLQIWSVFALVWAASRPRSQTHAS